MLIGSELNLSGVDHKDWDNEKRAAVAALVFKIQLLLKGEVGVFLEIGKQMLDLKEQVGHGSFEAIRKANFSIPKRSANRYAAAAKEFWRYREQVAHLYQSDLQDLAEKESLCAIKDKLLLGLEKGFTIIAKSLHAEIGSHLRETKSVESKGKLVRARANMEDIPVKNGSSAEMDNGILDMLDSLLPKSKSDQIKLLEFLSDSGGGESAVHYLRERLTDLLKHYNDSQIQSQPHITENLVIQ